MEPNVSFTQEAVVLHMRLLEMTLLVAQTAACVIQACEEYPPFSRAILAERLTHWVPQAFTNALIVQAEFLYGVVKGFVDGCGPSDSNFLVFVDPGLRKLVIDALSILQDWEARLCKRMEVPDDEFVKKDFSDQNEKLTTLYQGT